MRAPLDQDSLAVERTELARLNAARAGNEGAFAELTQPWRREIHVHCYRMLGSLDDADDALQETLLRAWRRLDRFEPRAPFRAWLYRIATNVCLTMLERRTRRREVAWSAPSPDVEGEEGEPMRLDPYPDDWLDEMAAPGPESIIERRESVELAFIAAVQFLPPRQRATLLLRDVIGYSAAEAAAMLATSVASVNSALQRARATLNRERAFGRVSRSHARPVDGSGTEHQVVSQLVDAWHAADVAAIVALLTEDAVLTMPPQPDRFVGPRAIGAFLSSAPVGGRLERYRLHPTRANGQPALAAYFQHERDGPHQAHALIVLALRDERIASLVRFSDPGLFDRFGLPLTVHRAD